ncbi:DUF2244 domain-containing protein [Ponticoccus alexandrii]|uniref:DUF2244 domain-containing protein n=1 Tax=Ponticoccus alexandrii TaxID=1943633 RepID=A0ABX7F8W7_9RHOB|nr:DUF2244 domain-containing protein [Ponticoccus alexandrii]QRF66838.1 DUF2244 domain-containing protein [Ponticoccus alexandrii]
MPYHWTDTGPDAPRRLRLWPHNSLSARGFAIMVLGFFLFASIPLYGLLGTVLLWGLLPFMLAATAGLYYALRRNAFDRRIVEDLTITADQTTLTHTDPRGAVQRWEAKTYWVSVAMHETDGPVPYYVTLKGAGREVELGAFLSEEERIALYDELLRAFAGITAPEGSPPAP